MNKLQKVNWSICWIQLLCFAVSFSVIAASPTTVKRSRSSFTIGQCTWVIDRKCPDIDIKFYLFTRLNPGDRQYVHIDETWDKSNLSTSFFDPAWPVKIILHGYNSDMFLTPLIDMKGEYLKRSNYNLFYVDWSVLAPGPCYPSAVHNTHHVGVCVAQLVRRLLEAGTDNVHLVGFSLGAQVTNYISNDLKPFRLKRISGLDPAMPLFVTVDNDQKLDASDADFVDVIHTNALVQGKIERCGHVDFYMNGGVLQPGCWGNGQNPVACSHHRAPDYFAESIRSFSGFWGWPCQSFIYYLLGFCPPTNFQVVAGEDCSTDTRGMFLITTNSDTPYAIGRWTDLSQLTHEKKNSLLFRTSLNRDPFLNEIDQWGKLDADFNNIEYFPTPYSQDPNKKNDDWPYFNHIGTKSITKNYIKQILEEDKTNRNKTTPIKKLTISDLDEKIKYLEDVRYRLQQKQILASANNYKLPVLSQH